MGKPAIVVHGGAINPLTEPFNRGVGDAVRLGFGILSKGGSALDAVTEAIVVMEDNPLFNAGTGSWLNLNGEIEMDAIIVDGRNITAGAVASIKRVKNPILVARKVMEETDHVLLVGEGAVSFARSLGFKDYDPLMPERMRAWRETIERLKRGEEDSIAKYWAKIKNYAMKSGDTVGGVAVDKNGDVAAGTSSGGFPLKLPGRAGDVPLIGCSTYASNRVGGVSLTGQGEVAMRFVLAKRIHDLMGEGSSPQRALEDAISFVLRNAGGKFLMAGIALDRSGAAGASRNTNDTPHAFMSSDSQSPRLNFGPVITKA